MIHVTCFKCRRRFDLDPVWVGVELRKLKAREPRYYQASCPSCHAVNKVSVREMQKELEVVRSQSEVGRERQEPEPQSPD